MAYTHTDKNAGDLIQSSDWNTMGQAVTGLNAKLDFAGNTINGPLTVKGALTTEAPAPDLTMRRTNNTRRMRLLFQNSGGYYVANVQTTGKADPDLVLRLGAANADPQALPARLTITNAGDVTLPGSLSVGGALNVSGNVGIGTTAPGAKLDVTGNTRLGRDIADSWFPYTNGWAYVSGKGIIFRDDKAGGYAERMRISEGGNVGIGTTTPYEKLTVDGRMSFVDGNRVWSLGASLPDGISASNDPETGAPVAGTFAIRDRWLKRDRLVIDSVGNVGIGTTTLAKKLHIQGANSAPFLNDGNDRPGLAITGHYPELNLFSSATNTSHGPTIRLGAYNDDSKTSFKHWVIGTAGRNAGFLDIGFSDQNDPNPHAGIRNYNGSTFLTLLKNGNVGIGTTKPKNKLDVAGGAVIGASYSGNNTAPTDGLLVKGKVGIGTTTPGYKLTVSATESHSQLRREKTESAGGKLLFLELYQNDDNPRRVSTVYLCLRFHHAYGYWHRIESRDDGFHIKEGDMAGDGYSVLRAVIQNASSRSLKKNIVDLSVEEAFGALTDLNPVKFNYKDADPRKTYVGFIAEDVPDLVATSDREALSPMDIIAVLTKTVQEQQKTLSALAEKVNTLQGVN